MIAVLRRRDFVLLWFGGLISMGGSWVLSIALPFYVYDLTGSTLATSAAYMANMLPSFLLGSVAGVFADRWDRKRIMVVADLSRALVLLLLLLVRSEEWLWLVYIVILLETTLSTFFGPAENALLPRLVGEEHLVAANSLNALNNNIARLVGPPLGGALFGLLGLPAVVLIDSASYLLSAILIGLISSAPYGKQEDGPEAGTAAVSAWVGVWRDWTAGLTLVKGDAFVASLFMVTGMSMLADGLFNALTVPFVDEVLRAEPVFFGWWAMAQGIGGLLGGVVVGSVGRLLSPARLLGLSLGWGGAIILVIVHLASVQLTLALTILLGVLVTGWAVGQGTLMQTSVPDRYRGRIAGASDTTNGVLRLMGLGLSGALADRVGLLPMLNAAGITYSFAGLLALVLLRRGSKNREAEDSIGREARSAP